MKANEKAEKALQSLDGVQRAGARPGLYDNVFKPAGQAVIKHIAVKKMVFARVAACMVLLAGINVFTVLHYAKKQNTANTNNAFVNEYFSY